MQDNYSSLCNRWIEWTSTGHVSKPRYAASECTVVVKSSSENMTVIPGSKSNMLRCRVLNFYTCIDFI